MLERHFDIAEEVREHGWVCLSYPETDGLDRLAQDLAGSESVSVARSELRPQDQSTARPFSLSGHYGLRAFEAHTDGANQLVPPRWAILRLGAGRESRTPTHLWDFADLGLGERLIDEMHRSMWVVHGGDQPFYSSILRPSEAGLVLRFNRTCMQPISRQSDDVGDRLVNAMVLTRPIEHHWRRNEVLVFDNWRMLHGRPPVTDTDTRRRRLERLLVSSEPVK